MTSVEFCYWLQGFFELVDPTTINATQTELIKAHLNMVFIHEIDPKYPEGQQEDLNKAHAAPFSKEWSEQNTITDSNGNKLRPRC